MDAIFFDLNGTWPTPRSAFAASGGNAPVRAGRGHFRSRHQIWKRR